MGHKVRVDIQFPNMDEYLTMKNQLASAGIHFNQFVNYCVDTMWNQMLADYKKQLEQEKLLMEEIQKGVQDEATSDVSSRNTESIPLPEGLDTSSQKNGNSAVASEG